MSETTEEVLRQVDKSAPAVMIRYACAAGPNRQMEMTFGVPLDMTVKDLNDYVDKVASVIDRQQMKGELERVKADLEGARKALQTQVEQKGGYQAKAELEFIGSGRKGEWKPTDSQRAQLSNWDTSIAELRDRRIPYFEREIETLTRKIAEGV